MVNSKCSPNFRNMPYCAKQSLLPPKSPFPSIPPSYADYSHGSKLGGKTVTRPREGYRPHQRTSSESFLMEEQPSWIEELLDEPGTPAQKSHRRASSDSFSYIDAANVSNDDNLLKEEFKLRNITSVPSRGFQDFDRYKDVHHASFYQDNSLRKLQNRGWESSLSFVTYRSGHPSASDNNVLQILGPLCTSQEVDALTSTITRKQDEEESFPHDPRGSLDRRDCPHTKPSAFETTDPKRAKQQFAQRSRVRKLQYIAELEKSVQVLQAEGSEISAELSFLDQQNIFLNIRNKALKQRLDSLAQEHVIKRMEQEMLEKEIRRLQGLYQQQQLQQQLPTHRRANSRDLDLRLANLSLKHMDTGAIHKLLSGPLQI